MSNQRAPGRRLFGGAAAKSDLRIVAIFTAVLSCVGISDLTFRSGGGIALIVIALLTLVGLGVLWRRWNRSRRGYARLPQHRSSRLQRTRIGFLLASHPSLSNGVVVVLIYTAALCLAGVGVTGGTVGTVVLVSFAVLASVGASAVFQLRQRARTHNG